MINPLEWFSYIYGKWFQGSPWSGGLVVGGTLCLILGVLFSVVWVKAIDKYNEEHPARENVVSTPTSVTLQFNHEDSTPVLIESKNVWRTTWFPYVFAEKETGKLLGKSWAVFLTFEKPVPTRQVVVNGHGHNLPAYQIVDAPSKSAVVVFSSDIVNTVVTIEVQN